jgi:hypothetical protein
MDCMTEDEADAYRKESGYMQHKSRRLFSMTMKEYLEFLEGKACHEAGDFFDTSDSPAYELEFVKRFLKFLDEEKVGFLERELSELKFLEMNPYQRKVYEQVQADKKKESEAEID